MLIEPPCVISLVLTGQILTQATTEFPLIVSCQPLVFAVRSRTYRGSVCKLSQFAGGDKINQYRCKYAINEPTNGDDKYIF
jgi:hypothetical protein